VSPTTVARPRSWKIQDVAEYLQICDRSVIRMCQRGQLPHLRIGKIYRFDSEKIIALFDGATPEQS
jgi:excisionase family DNA binding protein